jgi:hypothetical protein
MSANRSRLAMGAAVASVATTIATLTLAGCSTASPDPLVAKATSATSSSITADEFTVTLKLSTSREVAGRPIDGTLIVVNRTGAPVESSGVSCGNVAVVLKNSHVQNPSVSIAKACATHVIVPPGRSERPIKILTTYFAGTSAGLPALPAGTYATTFDWPNQHALMPEPRPIKVVLVNS